MCARKCAPYYDHFPQILSKNYSFNIESKNPNFVPILDILDFKYKIPYSMRTQELPVLEIETKCGLQNQNYGDYFWTNFGKNGHSVPEHGMRRQKRRMSLRNSLSRHEANRADNSPHYGAARQG